MSGEDVLVDTPDMSDILAKMLITVKPITVYGP